MDSLIFHRDYDTAKRFMMIIRFGNDEPLITRIKEDVPKIKETIEKYSQGENELAFTSKDASIFTVAYLIKTKTDIRNIIKDLRGTLVSGSEMSVLLNDDSFFAVELGHHFISYRFDQVAAWLQHH